MLRRIHNFLYRRWIRLVTFCYHFFGKEECVKLMENYRYYRQQFLEFQKITPESEYAFALIPIWKKYIDAIGDHFSKDFTPRFLTHPLIIESMFVHQAGKWQREQLAYMETLLPKDELARILKENHVGHPKITSLQYLTSHNSIHHLHHLIHFSQKISFDLSKTRRVLEWGGGYGNMAKLLLRIAPHATYIIIDLPVFIFLQATYLSTIFGKEKIHILKKPTDTVVDGKINLIPLQQKRIEHIDFGKVDFFASTWALSESSDSAQAWVEKLNYWNSKHLLLAYQRSSDIVPFGGELTRHLRGYEKMYEEKIPYIKGENYYLFAKRL